MAIGEQFAGLDMGQLIGGPLTAAADASVLLANSTADFINKVGFDRSGKLRTVAFAYQKRSVNEDGTSNLDEMKIDVPMLAIVPIPNLQLDEVNILFDMEVKQSESSQQSLDVGASLTGSLNLGIIKVSISGSVSVHQENTRKSDNSAKYHVDVRATNHGTPEGLARVLDMMAANVAPTLVGSTIKDGNGQNLPENARIRAEKKKQLRNEIMQIETRLNAANDNLDNCIAQLKRVAGTQQNVYHAEAGRLLNKLDKDKEDDTKKAESYEQALEQVTQSWNTLQNQAGNMVKMLSDSMKEEDVAKMTTVSELFALQEFKGGEAKAYESSEAQYKAMVMAQNNAVTAQKNAQKIEKELLDKKQEYNNELTGISTAKPSPPAAK